MAGLSLSLTLRVVCFSGGMTGSSIGEGGTSLEWFCQKNIQAYAAVTQFTSFYRGDRREDLPGAPTKIEVAPCGASRRQPGDGRPPATCCSDRGRTKVRSIPRGERGQRLERAVAAAGSDLSKLGWLHQALVLGALAIVYLLAGKLGLHFASVHESASAVWPPTGIALAAVLLLGRRTWPAIFVGAFLVNLTTSGSLVSSLGIAVGNTLEATIGALLVARYAGGTHAFERPQDFLRFVAFGGLLGTAVSATIGATTLVTSGEAERAAFGAIWLTWWFGDAAGALIVTPVLVRWGRRGSLASLRAQPFEAVLLLIVVATTGALVFAHSELSRHPLPFLCIPPLIRAAFRFGQREVATSVALLSAIATWATVRGSGPFATGATTTNRYCCCRPSWSLSAY